MGAFLLFSTKNEKRLEFPKPSILLLACPLAFCALWADGGDVMNKSDLITQVAETCNLTKKDASQAVDAVFDAITESLKSGEKVQLIGFGNFEVRERAARKGRNPQTGEEIDIAASKVPAFKPGKALKDLVQ